MAIGNQIKTAVLLGALTGLLLWVGSMFGRQGLLIGLAFTILMNLGTYWFSDKIVLMMYGARKVSESEEPRLHKLVGEVSKSAMIPKPGVYILPSPQSNAFATGRSPKKAAVACTRGILDSLDDDELKGVIAHEMSHIKNRDTLIAAVAATIAGVISYAAMMVRWGAMFGGYGGRDRDNNGLEMLALAILTPLIATIIQLAISRSREYLADERAAKILKDSSGLASALSKLESGARRVPSGFANKTGASLFIVNPFSGGGLINLFSTHPPIKERISRLNNMKI